MAEFLGILRTLLPSPELLREVGTQEVAAMAPWAAREFSKRYVATGGVELPKWGCHPSNGGCHLPNRGCDPSNSSCHPLNTT